MWLNKRFNGSAFDDIPEELIGWFVLAVAMPLTIAGVFKSMVVLAIAGIFGIVLGVAFIVAAQAYRFGFRDGRAYDPPLIMTPSIGPP